MDEEFIDRFVRLCCDGDRQRNTSGQLLLSRDRVMGIPLMEDSLDRYVCLGRFKLKEKPREIVRVVADLCLDLRFLYHAMRILHRRKKVELGLFNLYNGWVFAVREKDNIILIAPAISDETTALSRRHFSEIINRRSKSLFKKWETWAKILYGNHLWR